jgi:hypothetical protein
MPKATSENSHRQHFFRPEMEKARTGGWSARSTKLVRCVVDKKTAQPLNKKCRYLVGLSNCFPRTYLGCKKKFSFRLIGRSWLTSKVSVFQLFCANKKVESNNTGI